MSQALAVQELAIVVAVKKYEPALLNPNLLSASGVVPGDWEFARQPVANNRLVQISYQNGVNIMAEFNRFMFIEPFKASESLASPAVAERYVNSLPNLDYQGLGLNFRGCYFIDGQPSEARDYLVNHLLAPGPWQTFGSAPMQVGLNLAYTLEGKRLNLNVAEAKIQRPEQPEKVPVILFSGNFDYGLATLPEPDRLERLKLTIRNWTADLKTFAEVVEQFPKPKSVQEMVMPPA